MRTKIVFWLPQGRLGNLIFQYQAAIALFPENSMIISLESEFSETFEYAPFVKFIPVPKVFRSRVAQYLVNIFRWCVKKNILGSIMPKLDLVENFTLENKKIDKSFGWFSMLWVIDGFFQHDHYSLSTPILKKKLLDSAEKLLHQIPQEKRVAVHLRFGDYKEWTVFGKQGVCLPSKYYQKSMTQIAQTINNPIFIIFSDDKKCAEKIIGNRYDTIYFDGVSSGIDIAGISLCNHAIVSASTFSWWGAFLINYPGRVVIAPKYWAGFKSRIWFPADIQTDCFEYVDVDKCG